MIEYKLNNFRLGLCGTHRVGKTTLAEHVSERLELPFIKTEASELFKTHCLKPDKPITPLVRLSIQTEILALSLNKWERFSAFITDCTPLDFISSLLMDYDQNNMNEELEEAYSRYIEHCFAATNQFFSSIVLVPQGVTMTREDASLSITPNYLNKQETLVRGLLTDSRLISSKYSIDGKEQDLDARGDAVIRTVLKNLRKAKKMLDTQVIH